MTRDAILAADDLTTEEVAVPEWGGTVLVRGMSGRERDAFETSTMEQRGRGTPTRNLVNLRAKLVARCIIGDDGERVFTDADVTALGEKSGAAIDRVFEVASRLSGMAESDMEDITRDFTPPSGASSPTPSRNGSTKQSRASSPK